MSYKVDIDPVIKHDVAFCNRQCKYIRKSPMSTTCHLTQQVVQRGATCVPYMSHCVVEARVQWQREHDEFVSNIPCTE